MKSLVNNIKKQKCNSLAALAILAATSFASCSNPTGNSTQTDSTVVTTETKTDSMATGSVDNVKPTGAKPSWAPDIQPQMQAVLEKLQSYGDKPIPQLTAVEARKNHTPTDAVMALMQENKIAMPVMKVDTMGKEIPVKGGSVHARIYTPQGGNGPFPVIVYYHGGGYVIANLDVYDASAKALADQVGAVVVSVAYRLAPEHKFPTAHTDSFDAYQWVVKNAASIKGDPKMIAVAGESAGGNLAANMAIMARDKGVQAPVHVLSVYPIASADMNSQSYTKYADAKPLDKPMMMWFTKQYTNTMSEAKDPRLNLVAANLKGLPAFTIINAELDPLASDGEMLEKKLKDAGVTVDRKVYNGVTHEFFGMGALVPEAKDAMGYAAGQLKSAFKK
ncbi:alpha/beta hydrolase [Mucilaginibacter aquatilis]|uniref:Alpha/beta hydrolase fold domain-containing protein n=1 Tax=Mucilaginibacter aquatilis TaxID=1517760 RepID=A0A6I4I385_9SPHI|nr:alpha/beta hydrolase [Mucilaginibacter aquatilis]MVN89511.1 alpha/beta hydrolase fold domain-containing protein [Mucilaginibacter aquatilis]